MKIVVVRWPSREDRRGCRFMIATLIDATTIYTTIYTTVTQS